MESLSLQRENVSSRKDAFDSIFDLEFADGNQVEIFQLEFVLGILETCWHSDRLVG